MYAGPPIDDEAILDTLPAELRDFLVRCNGYVAFDGGFHVRGACINPTWHSLRYWWLGAGALHALFPLVEPSDIPFAEDALGDQYLLRGGLVYRLSAELGELRSLGVDLRAFDLAVRKDPVGYLSLEPLEEFRSQGGTLEPGQLLSVYPPFATKEAATGVSYKAVPTADRIRFLAEFARQVANVKDGGQIALRFRE